MSGLGHSLVDVDRSDVRLEDQTASGISSQTRHCVASIRLNLLWCECNKEEKFGTRNEMASVTLVGYS